MASLADDGEAIRVYTCTRQRSDAANQNWPIGAAHHELVTATQPAGSRLLKSRWMRCGVARSVEGPVGWTIWAGA